MSSVSLLLSSSHHLTASNDIIRSDSACSNFVPTITVDKSKPKSESDKITFSEEAKQLAGLSDSIRLVSRSIAFSPALCGSFDFWFSNSERLSISVDPAMSQIFGSGQFPAAGSFPDGSAQQAGSIWTILGSVLSLLLLLCCLVLFLLWRRKAKSSYGAEIPDECDLEFGTELGDGPDYDHEYYNPLESDSSMTDDEGDLHDSWEDDMDQSVDASGAAAMELSDWFPSEGKPMISDEQEAGESEDSFGGYYDSQCDREDDLSFGSGSAGFDE